MGEEDERMGARKESLKTLITRSDCYITAPGCRADKLTGSRARRSERPLRRTFDLRPRLQEIYRERARSGLRYFASSSSHSEDHKSFAGNGFGLKFKPD